MRIGKGGKTDRLTDGWRDRAHNDYLLLTLNYIYIDIDSPLISIFSDLLGWRRYWIGI